MKGVPPRGGTPFAGAAGDPEPPIAGRASRSGRRPRAGPSWAPGRARRRASRPRSRCRRRAPPARSGPRKPRHRMVTARSHVARWGRPGSRTVSGESAAAEVPGRYDQARCAAPDRGGEVPDETARTGSASPTHVDRDRHRRARLRRGHRRRGTARQGPRPRTGARTAPRRDPLGGGGRRTGRLPYATGLPVSPLPVAAVIVLLVGEGGARKAAVFEPTRPAVSLPAVGPCRGHLPFADGGPPPQRRRVSTFRQRLVPRPPAPRRRTCQALR